MFILPVRSISSSILSAIVPAFRIPQALFCTLQPRQYRPAHHYYMSENNHNHIPINPQTRIGHVHLKVANLERALGFYHGVLGLEVMERSGTAAFLSAGGYHHHIALNTWQSLGGTPPPPGTTGLYHLAILYPTRAALADALRRLVRAGIQLDGASDHGVSEALYLHDPDGNGVELYRDRPREQWPRTPDGQLAMTNNPLDLDGLLHEPTPAQGTAL